MRAHANMPVSTTADACWNFVVATTASNTTTAVSRKIPVEDREDRQGARMLTNDSK